MSIRLAYKKLYRCIRCSTLFNGHETFKLEYPLDDGGAPEAQKALSRKNRVEICH